MKQFLPFIIFGITTGSIYGLAAMGLVLTYKTSGLFNFGHGAVGAGAAYGFYSFRSQLGLPWPVAALLAVGVIGLIAGLVMERFARALAPLPTSRKVVATIGLLLFIRGLAIFFYGDQFKLFATFLPQRAAFTVGGVPVSWDNVITTVLAATAALALYLLFRGTRLGRSMRAAVDDPQLLDMSGESPTTVRRTARIIGAVFAAASGVLFASTQQQLDATLLSLLVVQAFGAAAIGSFTSLPLAYVGGIGVGFAQKLLAKEVASSKGLAGLDVSLPFIVLFVVLLVVTKKRLVEFGHAARASAAGVTGSSLSPGARRMVAVGTVVAALAVPLVVGSKLPLWLNAATLIVLFLSLGLLVNTSGQISLCHIGFAAIGAATFGHTLASGLPWGLAVLAAGVVAVPVGALIAIPAVRLSGLFLALATLGFGILLAQFFYLKSFMFGLSEVVTRRPDGFAGDQSYYYLCIAIAFLLIAMVIGLERSRLGRLLRALADSPRALTTLGASETICRVLVFCVSAFLAGISGALFAGQFKVVTLGAFPFVQSLILLAVVVIAGRRTVTAALVGPILLYVVPGYITNQTITNLLPTLFGLGAIVVAISTRRAPRARRMEKPALSTHGHRIGVTPDRIEAMRSRPQIGVGRVESLSA
jgi:ABC-type branched-subunit amino acid transport system permease subunit